MATRMEKYHKNENTRISRSRRNKSLYNDIYSYGRYSNIEGVAPINKNNEIDMNTVKELLDSRDKYQDSRNYRNSDVTYEKLPTVRKRYTEDTESNYDIMDVLKEAREKKMPDNKERVLSDTNYDVLKSLNLNPKMDPSEYKKENLSDIIETISNTSMLNKIDDNDLAMDLFHELRDDDTKVGEIKDITEFMNGDFDKSENTMDDSFFTSGLKLKKTDFSEGKSSHGFLKFLKVLFILILIGGIIFLALYYFGIVSF